MQIVIKIDNKRYKDILRISTVQLKGRTPTLEQIIANGTPLPEHHGRLIDADNITFSQFFDAGDYAQARRGIYEAPTIIEADKESDSE